MIDSILATYADTTFDFREYAKPDDEFSFLFDEWVNYYRLKYAICKALNPASILEIGVRYGYSAITFLKAASGAKYVGIDNNSPTFGGSVNAIDWAKGITQGMDATFVIGDTQQMATFPGERYDLIHIDGQQDGDGTYHDLELSFEKGKWILVDGYFWSQENMLSSTHFLKKYQKFIEYALVIPGYAGELLIKVKEGARPYFGRVSGQYKGLDASYDSEYYLTDCGGYDSFKKYGGRKLEDPRLMTILALTAPSQGQKVLDLGCGRGELAYALAKQGAMVTAIDYSQDAIEIARQTYAGEALDLEFIHGDFFELSFPHHFDSVVASDVLEHLEQPMLEKMMARVAELLTDDGRFIIHTAPNKLNLEYVHKQKRALASKIGCYLPKNPRTYYEDLMHLNEQTPSRLNSTLKRHFPRVITWVTTLPDPVGSLTKPLSKNSLREGSSLFAVASHKTINREQINHCLNPLGAHACKASGTIGLAASSPSCSISNHLAAAEAFADPGTEVTPMLQFTGFKRWLALHAGKLVVYLASFITARQRAFNHAVLEALKCLAERANHAAVAGVLPQERIGTMVSVVNDHTYDDFYIAFEDRFRGSHAEVRKRLEVYLPVVGKTHSLPGNLPIMDIGCGRGEWLELLRDHGYAAKGIDTNRVALARCRELGLDVFEADALEYLCGKETASCAAVTGFHIVEHLPFAVLMDVMREAFRILQPGGILIFETPDPENVIVGTRNFYLDPTHHSPLPDETLAFIAEYCGFVNREVLKLQQISDLPITDNAHLNEVLRRFSMAQDYAVIGYKPR